MIFKNYPRVIVEEKELDTNPYVVISITEKSDDNVELYKSANLVDMLRLYFDDLDRSVDDYEYILFNRSMAKQICAFVTEHSDKKLIAVHCTAGISRSAGIAAALNKFYNGDDSYYFKSFCPNMLCYKLVLEELTNSSVDNCE